MKFYSLDDPAFGRLFLEFRETAFRLETRQNYDVNYETVDYRRFLSGMTRDDVAGIGPWVKLVRDGVAADKHFQRVHVVREPLSDYLRFECAWEYRYTVAVGEDVRVIPVSDGDWPEGLPNVDFWLFDDQLRVTMKYAPDGAFLAGEITEEAGAVASAIQWRAVAVHSSTSFREYDQRFDDRMLERSA
jgi:hypothetical protein